MTETLQLTRTDGTDQWVVLDPALPEPSEVRVTAVGIVLTTDDLVDWFDSPMEPKLVTNERGQQALGLVGMKGYNWDLIGADFASVTRLRVEIDTLDLSSVVFAPDAMAESVIHQTSLNPAEVAQSFHHLLASVSGVEAILVNRDDDGFQVFTLVNQVPYGERDDIHDAEWRLMSRYPASLFEFRIVDRRQAPIPTLLSVESFDVYLRV